MLVVIVVSFCTACAAFPIGGQASVVTLRMIRCGSFRLECSMNAHVCIVVRIVVRVDCGQHCGRMVVTGTSKVSNFLTTSTSKLPSTRRGRGCSDSLRAPEPEPSRLSSHPICRGTRYGPHAAACAGGSTADASHHVTHCLRRRDVPCRSVLRTSSSWGPTFVNHAPPRLTFGAALVSFGNEHRPCVFWLPSLSWFGRITKDIASRFPG